jgi:hypothetical protein
MDEHNAGRNSSRIEGSSIAGFGQFRCAADAHRCETDKRRYPGPALPISSSNLEENSVIKIQTSGLVARVVMVFLNGWRSTTCRRLGSENMLLTRSRTLYLGRYILQNGLPDDLGRLLPTRDGDFSDKVIRPRRKERGLFVGKGDSRLLHCVIPTRCCCCESIYIAAIRR